MDPLPGLLGFTRALAAAGLRIGAQRATAFTQAASHLDLADPDQLYWAGRATLCGEPDDIEVYERVFTAWFDPHQRNRTPRPRASTQTEARIAALSTTDGDGAESEENDALRVAASEAEILRNRDLKDLSDSERAHLRRIVAGLKVTPPLRTGHRHRPARGGAIDPRRTLRAMLASGGEPVRLRHLRDTPRPRRTVLLVDVSGSMSPYADALLRFANHVSLHTPTETFTVGTRLTRVTRALRHRDPERALREAAQTVPDWAGGTRLGEALKIFCDRWGQRGLARRAVIVVFSDGWERGDTTLLATQMRRLHLLAHRILWVNPHAGKAGYQPVQSGIAAALPYVDVLLAGHSVHTLDILLQEVRDA